MYIFLLDSVVDLTPFLSNWEDERPANERFVLGYSFNDIGKLTSVINGLNHIKIIFEHDFIYINKDDLVPITSWLKIK